jgi:hypothetical protein
LKKIVDGGTFNNLIPIIVHFLIDLSGLLVVDVVNKVVCFGANNVTIFQGLKTSVTIQLMNKHNPFIIGFHCMAHQCNLAMQIFSSLSLVINIEALFSSMCTYYN